MGRPKTPVDMDAVLDLLMRGETIPTVSDELGISPPTLRNRIADLTKKQGLLLRYREIQTLQLTELQARILEAITPEKIDEASLRDLVMSYKILKDKEHVIEGKPTEIKGLVAHLIHLEQMEAAGESVDVECEDASFEYADKSDKSELAELDDSEF